MAIPPFPRAQSSLQEIFSHQLAFRLADSKVFHFRQRSEWKMKQVLFEPWNLGDALIATAIALQAPERLALACNTRWQTLIRLATPPDSCALDLIAADLAYVNRDRKSPFSLGQLPEYTEIQSVLSIRGDLRDYVAAKRIFPKASVQVSGWAPFF